MTLFSNAKFQHGMSGKRSDGLGQKRTGMKSLRIMETVLSAERESCGPAFSRLTSARPFGTAKIGIFLPLHDHKRLPACFFARFFASDRRFARRQLA